MTRRVWAGRTAAATGGVCGPWRPVRLVRRGYGGDGGAGGPGPAGEVTRPGPPAGAGVGQEAAAEYDGSFIRNVASGLVLSTASAVKVTPSLMEAVRVSDSSSVSVTWPRATRNR